MRSPAQCASSASPSGSVTGSEAWTSRDARAVFAVPGRTSAEIMQCQAGAERSRKRVSAVEAGTIERRAGDGARS